MLLTLLTVIVAGALGGAIAVGLTAAVVITACVLAAVAIGNGVRMLSRVWTDLSPD
jgi:hypothetical protein